ncbi:hypothetical protein [Bacillus sp. FJAT-50079]|uniref:hypothetical protein n=1 Tax=Bacillus sp. FJAT-50079 TaxID=2833577 RepID=UPI001BCA026F|nr:hypothetical protein [Bacillus sp. FJAT-50079]MBS4207597.1 hypothetical protein [Bacillus sp. FJAT-50079]
MTGTFIFLLFMLNGVTIFAVVLLYLRQNRLKEIEEAQRKNQEESAELLSAFLLELKEENEQFLSIIQQLQKQNKDQKKPIAETYKETKDSPQPTMLNQEQPITAETYATLLTYPDENINQSAESDAKAEKAETMQTSLIDQAYQLQSTGVSIDEIAKKLHKGKTEIALMLKFRRK